MYERHFGFLEKPFNLTPDSRYLFLSPKHQEAYANLEFGVRERAGFLLLTGEIGTGKTTLIRHFLSQVGKDVRTAVILYPALSAGEMFHAILQDLEVPFAGGSLKDAVDTLANALIEAKSLGLKVVVLIDEAQNLKPPVLEQLRLLSNLETEREKLLTLVLVGQPELRDLLDQPALRQLSQRITSRSHLEPLSAEETRHYVRHRLVVAGGAGTEFDDEALRQVHSLSGGVPRVVNVLCDRALVGAFGRGLKSVDVELVEIAGAEVLPGQDLENTVNRSSVPWPALALFAVGLVLMLPLRFCLVPSGVQAPDAVDSAVAVVSPTAAPPGSSAFPSTPGTADRASSSSTASLQASVPQNEVRCGTVANSRSAAIAAIETYLGTPGFDSAQAQLSFEQWRTLKLPAIALFRSAMGPCEAAVLPLDAVLTQVSDASGDYVMENTRLKDLYLGTAIICFVDRDAVLAKPEGERIAWARRLLERRSLLARGASEALATAALARVGLGVGLKGPASVEGALLAALYSIDGGTPRKTGTK
jgi:type II secretory pathway predicted ATPase ExeA